MARSSEREVWREARRRINECETKKAEVYLDEQKERRLIKTYKDRLAEIEKNIGKEKAEQERLAGRRVELKVELESLGLRFETAQRESVELARVVGDLKRRLKDLESSKKSQRAEFEDHIRQQTDFKSQWEEHRSKVLSPNYHRS